MISIHSLTKKYKTGEREITALNAVTYRFPETGLIFFVGKSGSGKSTLLNLLGGFDYPTSGSVVVDGNDLSSFTLAQFDSYRNNYVGFIFQNFNLMADLTVEQNVGYALELQRASHRKDKVKRVLSDVGLADIAQNKVNQLSGGQQQRVAIARAIVKEPKLILADEPTGNLDGETGNKIFELLKKISSNRLVIVVTHDIDAAQKFGDKIIAISNGSIVDSTIEQDLNSVSKCSFDDSFHLKISSIVYYGVKSLSKNLYKMFLGLLLAVIAFTSFAVALFAYTTDNDDLRFENIARSDIQTAIVRHGQHEGLSYDNILDIMQDHDDLSLNKMLYAFRTGNSCLLDINKLQEFDSDGLTFYLEVNQSNNLLYSDLLVQGSRMAQADNEIVIPYSFAMAAMHCGFTQWYWRTVTVENVVDGEVVYESYQQLTSRDVTINNIDDLIGMTLPSPYHSDKLLEIVGIFDNSIQNGVKLLDLYEANQRGELSTEEQYYYSGLYDSYINAREYYLDVGLVSQSFFQDSDLAINEENYHVLQLVLSGDDVRDDIETLESEGLNVFTLADALVHEAQSMRESMSTLFLILSVFVGVFACLLIYFIFNGNINKNHKKLGVMRALGTRCGDIIAMYCIQGVIVGLIIFIFSVPLSLGFINVLDYSLLNKWNFSVLGVTVDVTMTLFAPVALIYLFAMIMFAIFAAIIFPVYKLNKIAPAMAVMEE